MLRDQAPDVLESLESWGVLKIPVDLGDGPADALLCSRRPVYEAVVRQALTAEPTVTVRAGTTVTDLVVRPGQVPVIEGVVVDAGETIRAGPVAGGMVLLGDSCLHINPTAGRGVSLAFAHAEHLALTIGGATDPLAYTAGFDSWTDAHIGVWYGPQAQADAAMARRIQAAVAGQPALPLDPAERLRSAAFHAARTDADVAVALRRMLHLVARPGEVLGNPAVVSQLRALVDARPELTAVAAGPTREELAA